MFENWRYFFSFSTNLAKKLVDGVALLGEDGLSVSRPVPVAVRYLNLA